MKLALASNHPSGCGCDLHKSVSSVNEAVRNASRLMRWKQAEQLAKRFVRRVLDLHVECVAGIISDLPGTDTWESVARRSKAMPAIEKKLTPEQVDRIILEGQEIIDPLTFLQVQQRINGLQTSLWPESSNPETVADNTLIVGEFPAFLKQSYEEGLAEGLRRLSESGAVNLEFRSVFNPNSLFAQKMYQEGFKYVTAKITRDFMPEVLKVMMKGVTAGRSWSQISADLYKEVGVGYYWQWERLVRTEITRAFDLSFTEEFQNYGVAAIKWSAAIGACPICVEISQFNGGYYPIVDRPHIPDDTHPNCRCNLIPIYNLPKGVTV